MSPHIRFIILSVLLGLIFIAVLETFVRQHESTHKAIFDQYDINSTIKYHWISGIWTSVFGETTPQTSGCEGDCEVLHEYNEIIGYNVGTLVLAMFGCLFFWFVVTETKEILI